MRSLTRALAAVATTAALTVAGLAAGGPAYADPSNGEGCAGLPSIPATYVCVIEVTPTNALPSTYSTPVPVDVPKVCYVAGCTDPAPVNVPVPGLTPGSGQVAVLWYQGQYIPVAAGTGTLLSLVDDVIDLANGGAGTVLGIANGAVATVNGVLDGLPSVSEIRSMVLGIVNGVVDEVLQEVGGIVDWLPTQDEIVAAVQEIVYEYRPVVYGIRDQVYDLRDAVVDYVNDRIDSICLSCIST